MEVDCTAACTASTINCKTSSVNLAQEHRRHKIPSTSKEVEPNGGPVAPRTRQGKNARGPNQYALRC
eukprot:1036608-Amphidinium_carterae.1